MKAFFTILLLFFVLFTNAQQWCTPNSIWYYDGNLASQPSIIKQTYIKDTLVNGITYNKLHIFNSKVGSSNAFDVYTVTQPNIVLFNAPDPTQFVAPIDTLMYFGTIGSKWHTHLRYGGGCAKSYIEINDTGTANIQAQTLKWKKIQYAIYIENLGGVIIDSLVGTDTIFERIGYKKMNFIFAHCGNYLSRSDTKFRCFSDNDIAVKSTNQNCNGNSTTVSIDEPKQLVSINFYPNPTNSILNIVDEKKQLQNAIIEIKNSLGQVVFTAPFTTPINLSDLTAGMYFLTIQDKFSKKMVKVIKE